MSKIFIDEIFSKKHYHVIYKAHLYIVYLYELTSTLVWIQLRIHLSRWWTDGGRLSEKHRGAKRHNGRPLLLHQYKYAICDRCLLLLRMLCFVCSTRDIFLPYPYPNTYLLLLSMSLVQNKLFCILIFFFLTIGARGSHFFTKDFICTEIMYAEDFQMLKRPI